MIANRNTVDTIVYLVKSDMISPRQGADIEKKIIFDIGWESIPVEEDVDGEVTHALSIIGTSDQRLRLRRPSGLKAFWGSRRPVSITFRAVLAA